mmetsp:Transcript_34876/g.62775  ORF Transcript_34876/g.62775 Transcript_34876/m.62775 type:complete len:294 (-) Transcript_34876:2608-3489(-)
MTPRVVQRMEHLILQLIRRTNSEKGHRVVVHDGTQQPLRQNRLPTGHHAPDAFDILLEIIGLTGPQSRHERQQAVHVIVRTRAVDVHSHRRGGIAQNSFKLPQQHRLGQKPLQRMDIQKQHLGPKHPCIARGTPRVRQFTKRILGPPRHGHGHFEVDGRVGKFFFTANAPPKKLRDIVVHNVHVALPHDIVIVVNVGVHHSKIIHSSLEILVVLVLALDESIVPPFGGFGDNLAEASGRETAADSAAGTNNDGGGAGLHEEGYDAFPYVGIGDAGASRDRHVVAQFSTAIDGR